MNFALKVTRGQKAGQEIVVLRREFLIGRADDCHLRPRSEMVSRHHCALVNQGASLTVIDLDSRTGTFVNGTRIRGWCELGPGDRLLVGPLEFEICSIRKPPSDDVSDSRDGRRSVPATGSATDREILHWLDDAEPPRSNPVNHRPVSGAAADNFGSRIV